MEIVVLITCFNRREKTEKCLNSLITGNISVHFHFVIVDDGSNDGTVEMLEKLKRKQSIDIVHGSGGLYYSGGMRKAMEYALSQTERVFDYVVLVNDDVEFFDHSIIKLISDSIAKQDAVIVGVTCDNHGNYTYGAIKYDKGIKYHGVGIEYPDTKCDTFNANCVVIPWHAFTETGAMDPHYVHSLGDFDYGLSLKRNGYAIYPSPEYVGICGTNNYVGTWGDKRLSRLERLKKKDQIKGLPWRPWFYFLRKNFGIGSALFYSATPYLKILFNK